jgi:hypothetical protein
LVAGNCANADFTIEKFWDKPDKFPSVFAEIENRGVIINNPTGLQNVFYLAAVDPLNKTVGVAYFLIWDNEFPDFGRKYKVNFVERLSQFFLPFYYTNWLYLPNSGGLQYLLFGKGDVEGIWAVYSFEQDIIFTLDFLSFELPGHNPVHFTSSGDKNNIRTVSQDNTPFVQIASWNHLFEPPDSCQKRQTFNPTWFPSEKWNEYNMDNNRADIVKNYLKQYVK